jgi:hypothetical protein
MLNCQKTSEEGGGAYDSPEVFPIIFAYSILLALHQRPSVLVYNEFGMEPYRAVRGRYREGWVDEHAYQRLMGYPTC